MSREKAGDGGIRFWVVSIGGSSKATSSTTHRIKLTLNPITRDDRNEDVSGPRGEVLLNPELQPYHPRSRPVVVPYADAMYSDEEAAALYDVLNPSGPSDDFYLSLVMDARSVLDVGCGTGAMLHRAREAGHAGRLCGLDPDRASLDVARRRTDIEWVKGTAASMAWDGEFDLAIMIGHAFQTLIGDEEVRASLTAIRRALAHGGHFAFETRNPRARAWESWHPENAVEVVDPSGRPVRISHDVESVAGDVVTLTETTSGPDGTPLRVDRASLRFLDVDTLGSFLADAGFEVEARYGGWLREPLDPMSPEIVTVARPKDHGSRSSAFAESVSLRGRPRPLGE